MSAHRRRGAFTQTLILIRRGHLLDGNWWAFNRHTGRLLLVAFVAPVVLSAGVVVVSSPSPLLSGYEQEVSNPSPGGGLMGTDIAVDGHRPAVVTPFVTSKAVTVMTRTDGTWSAQTPTGIIEDPDPTTDEAWGSNVAIEGETLAVGARHELNESGVETGGVHFFERTPTDWVHRSNITGHGFESLFGRSLAYEDNTLVVGAPHQNRSGNPYGGTVHIYQRTNGSWNRTQELTPPSSGDGEPTYEFGFSLDFEGSQLLIGSPAAEAFLYEVENGTAEHVATLRPPSDFRLDDLHYTFGWRVAIDGDKALVGSPHENVAFGYDRTPTGWTLAARLESPDGPRNNVPVMDSDPDNYGRDVDLVDGQAIVAASEDDVRSLNGNVFIYNTADWSLEKTIRPPTHPRGFRSFGSILEARQGELFVTHEAASAGGSLVVSGSDSDRDGLGDAHETEVLGSDPLDRDTDGDLFSDYTERFGRVLDTTDTYLLRGGSDPANPASVPAPPRGGVTVTEETRGEDIPILDEHGPVPQVD